MKKIFCLIAIFTTLHAFSQQKFKYHWRQISGPINVNIVDPDSATTLVTGLNWQGFYDFEFSVTNDFGTGYDTCRVTVFKNVLSIPTDSDYAIQRPKIKKLDIKMIEKAGEIYVQIKSPRLQTITCVIYDVAGRALAKSDIKVKEGYNYAKLPKPRVQGVYVIKFLTYFESVTQKVFL